MAFGTVKRRYGYRTRRYLSLVSFILSMLIGLESPGWLRAQEPPRQQSDRDSQRTTEDQTTRERAGRPRGHTRLRYPRQFDLRPQFYRQGRVYRFGIPALDRAPDEELERAYRRGLEEGRYQERYELHAERGLEAYQHALSAGRTAFLAGDYGLAARQWLLAATLNQGDPISRLRAAHAHTALGDYEPAARLLRRAFELEPRMLYLPLDIRGAYGNQADFTKHVQALRQTAGEEPTNADLWFLLGYYYYYSNDMYKATDALTHAAELRPEDRLFARMAALARTTAPPQPKEDLPKPPPPEHDEP